MNGPCIVCGGRATCRCAPIDRSIDQQVRFEGLDTGRASALFAVLARKYRHNCDAVASACAAAANMLNGSGVWVTDTQREQIRDALELELLVRAEGDDPHHYLSIVHASDADIIAMGRAVSLVINRPEIAHAAE
jgi:2,4-dienoyl-CoA reductase-like NADH-dependent reductase (Old Yellow Enzyme family)